MTEYIVMKQVVDAFYAFKEFSAEAKQILVMNSYNYWVGLKKDHTWARG
jgi:hypothetical protein